MRIAERPEVAETFYQQACMAGVDVAETRLDEVLLSVLRPDGTFDSGQIDVHELVRIVVDAALIDAGSRLARLTRAADFPFPPGSPESRAYMLALSDAGHVLGACPEHRALQLRLRHAREN